MEVRHSPTPGRQPSGRKVFCQKFQKEMPGLDTQPWPGELGQRIYENISAEAWKLWEERMKMILNEYRLMPWQKEAQELVTKHMEDFFFGEGAALPPATSRSRPSRLQCRPHAGLGRQHTVSLHDRESPSSIVNAARACAARTAASASGRLPRARR